MKNLILQIVVFMVLGSLQAQNLKTIKKDIETSVENQKEKLKSLELLEDQEKSKLHQLKPLLLIILYITTASILLHFKNWSWNEFMLDFMGLFFIIGCSLCGASEIIGSVAPMHLDSNTPAPVSDAAFIKFLLFIGCLFVSKSNYYFLNCDGLFQCSEVFTLFPRIKKIDE